MDNLYEIIGYVLAVILVSFAACLVPKVHQWLTANTDAATEKAILLLVRSFVRAAEQMLKEGDDTGAARKKFVLEQLQEAGVEITETVLNMIESEVWAVNQAIWEVPGNDSY